MVGTQTVSTSVHRNNQLFLFSTWSLEEEEEEEIIDVCGCCLTQSKIADAVSQLINAHIYYSFIVYYTVVVVVCIIRCVAQY
jgi:hypothetical protein